MHSCEPQRWRMTTAQQDSIRYPDIITRCRRPVSGRVAVANRLLHLCVSIHDDHDYVPTSQALVTTPVRATTRTVMNLDPYILQCPTRLRVDQGCGAAGTPHMFVVTTGWRRQQLRESTHLTNRRFWLTRNSAWRNTGCCKCISMYPGQENPKHSDWLRPSKP